MGTPKSTASPLANSSELQYFGADLQPQLVDALVGNVFKDLRPLFDALGSFSKSKNQRHPGAVTT